MISSSSLTNKIYQVDCNNNKTDITDEVIREVTIMLIEGADFNQIIKNKKDGKTYEICVKEYKRKQV